MKNYVIVSSLMIAGFLSFSPKTEANSSSKKTVAELMAQIKQESRGGKLQLQKGETSLPDSQLPFAPLTQRNLEEIKPPRSAEIFKREGGLKAEYEKAGIPLRYVGLSGKRSFLKGTRSLVKIIREENFEWT